MMLNKRDFETFPATFRLQTSVKKDDTSPYKTNLKNSTISKQRRTNNFFYVVCFMRLSVHNACPIQETRAFIFNHLIVYS